MISFSDLDDKYLERLLVFFSKAIHQEYPNKLNQVLGGAKEIETPRSLHPVFFGCFDWHSAVHTHWSIFTILRFRPDIEYGGKIVENLNLSFTPENIKKELLYFERATENAFERPYGWAWLLKLQEELNESQYPQFKVALQPLTDLIVNRFKEYLPKLIYAVRSGEHTNTAFALSLAYDYAISVSDQSFLTQIMDTSIRLFSNDKACPLYWEPSGYDFLSPCLEEANLMSKILEVSEFKKWMHLFLPELFNPQFNLKPAMVSDRKDGKLSHLDGLNFSRGWCLKRIGKVLDEHHLTDIADQLIKFSSAQIMDGNYAGDHWLATFLIKSILDK